MSGTTVERFTCPRCGCVIEANDTGKQSRLIELVTRKGSTELLTQCFLSMGAAPLVLVHETKQGAYSVNPCWPLNG